MDTMSVISGTTSSSILKAGGISSRERAKSTIVKEVRFETHEDRRVRYVLEQVLEYGNIQQYEKFLSFITSEQIQVHYFTKLPFGLDLIQTCIICSIG